MAKKNQLKENNPNWKGGMRIAPNGYVFIHIPDHPHCYQKGYMLEHRMVMEKKIGRFLKSHEFVHHKNSIRHDNRPENLEIVNSGFHVSRHNKNRTWKDISKEKHRLKAMKIKRDNRGRFCS